ncbi:MAG: HAD-IIB family hydrolase [bacterium]
MLPDKKIIAFDIDGTLTVSKRPISEGMASLIKELIKRKMVITIAGGSFKQLETQFLPPFFKDESMLPFISNFVLLPTSGSQRYQFDEVQKKWMLKDKEPLAVEIREKAKKLLKEIIDSGQYDVPPNPKGEIVEDRETQVTFSALGQQAPIEEKILWDPDQSKRKKIVAVIGPQLPGATVLINSVSSIDILPKGFNKAVGLTRFLDKAGFKKSDVIFIGDGIFPGGNDYAVKEAGFETIAVGGPKETEVIIKGWLG